MKVDYPLNDKVLIEGFFKSKKSLKEEIISCNYELEYWQKIINRVEANLIPVSTEDRRQVLNKMQDSPYHFEAVDRYEARAKQDKLVSTLKELIDLNNTLITELKEAFNADFATTTVFTKVFFFRKLFDFSRYGTNIDGHIEEIKDQANFFEGEVKDFFLRKVLAEIIQTNQKVEYAEHIILFKKAFKKEFGSIEIIRKELPNNTPSTSPKDIDFTQKEIALFYYYLIEADFIPMPSPKKEGLFSWATAWGKSGQKLYLAFNEIQMDKERLKSENIQAINNILVILQYFPSALALAKKELLAINGK